MMDKYQLFWRDFEEKWPEYENRILGLTHPFNQPDFPLKTSRIYALNDMNKILRSYFPELDLCFTFGEMNSCHLAEYKNQIEICLSPMYDKRNESTINNLYSARRPKLRNIFISKYRYHKKNNLIDIVYILRRDELEQYKIDERCEHRADDKGNYYVLSKEEYQNAVTRKRNVESLSDLLNAAAKESNDNQGEIDESVIAEREWLEENDMKNEDLEDEVERILQEKDAQDDLSEKQVEGNLSEKPVEGNLSEKPEAAKSFQTEEFKHDAQPNIISLSVDDIGMQTQLGYSEEKKPILHLKLVFCNRVKHLLTKKTVCFKETNSSREVWFVDNMALDFILEGLIGEENMLNYIGYIEIMPEDELSESGEYTDLRDIVKEIEALRNMRQLQECIICGHSSNQCQLFRCSKCKKTIYCSRICARVDEKNHAQICKKE